jgi:hypothetical protein
MTKPWEKNWNVVESESKPWEESWVTQEDANKNVAKVATKGDPLGTWDLSKYKRNEAEIEKNKAKNTEMLRKVAQGFTFGFADEIEAGVRSALGDREYRELRDEIRDKGIQFALENPKLSAALEIAGAIAMPGLGAAKLAGSGLKGAVTVAGTQGALYGAGQANEISDIPTNVLKSGGIGVASGGIINRAGALIAPKLAPGAKKLMNEGVELTPGQAVGGVANAFEESLTQTLPGIAGARSGATKTWNKVIANKVVAPLGKKIPKNVNDINDMASFVRKAVDEAYDDALLGSKIVVDPNSKLKLKNLLDEAELSGISKRGLATLKKEISLYKRLIGKGVSDKTVKTVDQNLRKRADIFNKSTNVADSEAADFIPKIRKIFKEELVSQNPSQGAKLLNVDKAYRDIVTLEGAIGAGTSKGTFTPNQLLQKAGQQGTSTASKRINKAGAQGYLQQSAKEAQAVIGDTLPQSGSGPRIFAGLATGGLLSGYAGGYLAPLLAIPGASAIIYSKPMQNMIRNWLNSGKTQQEVANLVKQYVTQGATSGLLTSMDVQ